MEKQEIDLLANNFISEVKNSKINIYNFRNRYDYSGCTDFLARETNEKLYNIDKLLGFTSVSYLFHKYLTMGLLKIYDKDLEFNKDNFQDFAYVCREKGYPLGQNLEFFAPYNMFANEFFDNILPFVLDYSRENKFDLSINEAKSINCEYFSDELKTLTRSQSCPTL